MGEFSIKNLFGCLGVALFLYAVFIIPGVGAVFLLRYTFETGGILWLKLLSLLGFGLLSALVMFQLFSLRRNLKTRIIYGTFEIVFGFLSLLLYAISKTNIEFIIFYANVYVMVRGLDNIHVYYQNKNKGLEIPKFLEKDRVLTLLLNRFMN